MKNHSRAGIASFVLSIIGLFFMRWFSYVTILIGLVSLFLGSTGMSRNENYGISCAGWVISIIVTAFSIIFFLCGGTHMMNL